MKTSLIILIASITLAAADDSAPDINFLRGAVTNANQRVDNMLNTIRNDPQHAGAAVVVNVLTGLDGQADNLAASVAEALSPFTLGISQAIGNVLLGPFVQSVTDGLEVLVGNLVGGTFDLVMSPVTGALQTTLSKLVNYSQTYKINTTRIENLRLQLQNRVVQDREKEKTKRDLDEEVEIETRQFNAIDSVKSGINNAQQRVDELMNTFKNDPGRGGAQSVTALLTGLDGQIDNLLSAASSALSPLTGGLSQVVGNILLGPFFQSVTDGLEVLIGNVVGGSVDLVLSPVTGSLQSTIKKVMNYAQQYNINTSRLDILDARVTSAAQQQKEQQDLDKEL
ncbi:hypothetical protein TRVA0_007S00298 [Trichomonascus vanleenenianus]|uniref:uncharacterized protein n=1 Tax=Trichomonascus vanleenenianus TaxID=2268995 RepID=UPI003ECB0024